MTMYRPATASDAEQLLVLATEMTQGTAFAPPTLEKVRRLISRPLGYGECAIVDGVIVGFMCGYIGETFLNTQVNAYEQGVFVAPKHRGGTIAVRLIKNFESWAKAQGAQNVWLGQSVGQKQESTMKFFERLGYTCQGFITCKKL